MFKKSLIASLIGAALIASPAAAGDKILKNAAGSKVKIHCTGGGCSVKEKKAGTKKYIALEKTKGGSKNYKILEAKYKAMGYK